MLTARGGVEEVTRGLAAGADDYLIKPFSTQDLVARVKALLADPVPGSKVAGEGGT
jgi:DNA-binding response OmpR family regulator